MAGPFGRLCRPLLNAAKNNVPEARHAENVRKSENALKNKNRSPGRHSRAEQQRKAAFKTFTDQGAAYVTSKEKVLALGRFHHEETEGEGEGDEMEEEKKEEEEEGVEEEEGDEEEGDAESEDEEEGDEDDPLGHKTKDWRKWKWQGKIVYSEDLDAPTRSSIVNAAERNNLKCKGYGSVDSLKK